MTKLWTNPRQWDIGELVDDLKLMEISNSLEWLKDRPQAQAIIALTGANFVQAVTGVGNWFAVDDTLFTLNITTAVANERVLVMWDGLWSSSGGAGSAMWWDILIDGTNYASTNSPTSASVGLGQLVTVTVAAGLQNFTKWAYFTIPTAGFHTLSLRVGGTSATSITLYKNLLTQKLTFFALDI